MGRNGFFSTERSPVPVTPKAFDTLLLLIENAGHVLSKEEIMEEVWEDSFVEENNLVRLSRHCGVPRRDRGRSVHRDRAEIRLSICRSGRGRRARKVRTEVFETTRSRIFIEDEGIRVCTKELPLPRNLWCLPKFRPETHYARNGDVNIAYQAVGEGEIDIVFVMGWVSHLSFSGKNHILRHS